MKSESDLELKQRQNDGTRPECNRMLGAAVDVPSQARVELCCIRHPQGVVICQ